VANQVTQHAAVAATQRTAWAYASLTYDPYQFVEQDTYSPGGVHGVVIGKSYANVVAQSDKQAASQQRTVESSFSRALAQMGANGWELVSISSVADKYYGVDFNMDTYTFKRPM
jgi:hypothetical protein